jgi:hypothetical protein
MWCHGTVAELLGEAALCRCARMPDAAYVQVTDCYWTESGRSANWRRRLLARAAVPFLRRANYRINNVNAHRRRRPPRVISDLECARGLRRKGVEDGWGPYQLAATGR